MRDELMEVTLDGRKILILRSTLESLAQRWSKMLASVSFVAYVDDEVEIKKGEPEVILQAPQLCLPANTQ